MNEIIQNEHGNITPSIGAPMQHHEGSVRLPGIEDQVREDTLRSGDPEYSSNLAEIFEKRSVEQVRCAGAVELGADSATMVAMSTAISDCAEEVAYQLGREQRALRTAAALRRTWAAIPRGLTLSRELCVDAMALVVSALTALGLARLTGETIHHYILAGVYSALRVAPRDAFAVAKATSMLLAIAAVAPLAVAVVATRGGLRWWLKVQFVAGEVLFACGFGAIRMSGAGWSYGAIAYGLLEVAVACLGTASILAIGAHLKEEHEAASRWEVARADVAAADRELAATVERRREAKQSYAAQMAAVQEREEHIADRQRRAALAAPTAKAAYLTSLGELYASLTDTEPAAEPLHHLTVVRNEEA